MPIIDRDPDSDLNQVKPVLEDLRDAVAEPHAKPGEPETGLRDGADLLPSKANRMRDLIKRVPHVAAGLGIAL